MSKEISYEDNVRSMEQLYFLTCLAAGKLEPFVDGFKLFQFDNDMSLLVSVDDGDFPTGLLQISNIGHMHRDGILKDFSGKSFELDVFVVEKHRGNGIAQKLTEQAEVYLKQHNKGEAISLLISLTIPTYLNEHNKMRTMLQEIGYKNTKRNLFIKEI